MPLFPEHKIITNEDHLSQLAIKELLDKLESGALLTESLPAAYRELRQFISETSEEGIAFQKYMEGLVLKILPNWDFAKHPIKFSMVDNDAINAFVIPGREPSIIGFHTGFLKAAKGNENLIIYVLCHELGHKMLRDIVSNATRISKPEEILVNLPGIQWMYENGLDPRAALDFALMVRSKSKSKKNLNKLVNDIISSFDEHLSEDFNIDTVNNALNAYKHQVAGTYEDRATLTVPKHMQQIFETAKYVDPTKQKLKQLKPSFSKQPEARQLEFIRDLVATISDGYIPKRVSHISKLLADTENDITPQSKAIGLEMLELLSPITWAYNELHDDIAINLINVQPATLLPPLSNLVPHMQHMVAAKDEESFKSAAREVEASYENIKRVASKHKYTWPNSYKFPTYQQVKAAAASGNAVTLPWEQHLQWAIKAANEGNPIPLKALMVAGVDDRRLFLAMPMDMLKTIISDSDRREALPKAPFEEYINNHLEGYPMHIFEPHFPMGMYEYMHVVPRNGRLLIEPVKPGDNPIPKKALELSPAEALVFMETGLTSPPAATRYTFNGTVPFTNQAELENWINTFKQSMQAPLCLTGDTRTIFDFQSRLMQWENMEPIEQSRALKMVEYERSQGRPPKALIYDKYFFMLRENQLIPFAEQSTEITKLFNHMLATGGKAEKELIRNFFLAPDGKPGFANLMSATGSLPALLTANSNYIRFILDAQLFDAEELGKILFSHLPTPRSMEEWHVLLNTKPVNDIASYFEFQKKQSAFLALKDESSLKPILESYGDKNLRKEDSVQKQTLNHLIVILGCNYIGSLDISNFLASVSLNSDSIFDKDLKAHIDVMEEDWLEDHLSRLLTPETIAVFTQGLDQAEFELFQKQYKSGFGEKYDQVTSIDREHNRVVEDFKDIYFENGMLKHDDELRDPQHDAALNLAKERVIKIPLQDHNTLRQLITHHIMANKIWPDDTLTLAKIYKNIDHLSLFPDVKWQEEKRDQLIKGMKTEPDPQKRIEIAKIFFGRVPLKDAVLKESITEIIISSLRDLAISKNLGLNGLDDGSKAYADFMSPYIEWASNNITQVERYNIFTEMAEELEFQRDLSYELRDSFKITKAYLEESDAAYRSSEAVLNFAVRSPANRKRLLNFYMNELTPESRKEFAEWLMMKRHHAEEAHELKTKKDKTPKEVAENMRGKIFIDELDDEGAFDHFRDTVRYSSATSYYEMLAQQLYDNYWHAPLPARVMVVDQLLIQVENKAYNDELSKEQGKAYENAFNYVVSKLIPDNIKYSAEAKSALKCYYNVQPSTERALFLSALLGASDIAQSSSTVMSAGERLAVMLEMMGPATTKFGQGIGNYRDAPMDIRQPMVRLTKFASPPTRWEIWERFDDVTDIGYRAGVKRLGAARNSASYNETVKTEKLDGSKSILVMQRPFVERRAQNGFETLRKFVHELQRADHGLDANVAEAADNIFQQAQKMAVKETDVCYRLEQVKQAQKYYNGLEVEVDGIKFKIKTANWLAYGVDREELPNRMDRKEWCDQEEMLGVHFDELPQATPEDIAYQKAAAKATAAIELMILLSGQPIDHDRHSAQMRIDKSTNTIGNFDHGAMNLHIPTVAEKKMLAKIVQGLISQYTSGGITSNFLQEQIDILKAENKGEVPDYIFEIERAFLAMMPFFEKMDKADLLDVVGAVLKNRDMKIASEILDTDIKLPLNLGDMKLGKLITKFSRDIDTTITISRSPAATPDEPQRFDYSSDRSKSHPVFPGAKATLPSASESAKWQNAVEPAGTYAGRV